MDPLALNILGPTQLVSSGLNKAGLASDGNGEGITGEIEDALTLKLTDDDLLELAQQWTSRYQGYEGKLNIRQDRNLKYYLGDPDDSGQPKGNNLIFEAYETFLPAALAKNPEPVVYSDNSKEGVQASTDLKTMLQYHADQLVLRTKLTETTRNWGIYFIGIMKHGWDKEISDIKSEVRKPKNFIFDPEGYVDAYGDYNFALGERIKCAAYELVKLYPKHKDYITVMVDGKMGTEVTRTEWWNDDYTFTTFKGKVIDKSKNPYFNYPTEIPAVDQSGLPEMGEEGKPVMTEQKGNNHFAKPKKPYTFLTVFSLGTQPHDITGLIEQNISNQQRITRRTDQIDINLTQANNSLALSGENFNEETGKAAAMARRKGNPILVPPGKPIQEAIVALDAQTYPAEAFNALETDKTDLRSIFGTQGITSQQPNEDTTARGMILNQQYDNSRIGGGIGDKLEQFSDNVFNWWTQLYKVFYDVDHFAAIMGQMKAVEYVELNQMDLTRQFIVTVSPDSLKSHDELTEMNQAMELFQAGVMDPKTLYTIMNVPDAQDTSEMAVLWTVDKNAYMQLNFPELAQQLQQLQMQQAQAQGQAQATAEQNGGQAGGASPPPQGPLAQPTPPSEPPNLSVPPAGSSLSQVPLPT